MNNTQILDASSPAARSMVENSMRPMFNKRNPNDQQTYIRTSRGLVVNSVLRKDEWESLDAAVVEAATQRLIGINHLRSLGLTKNEGNLGVLVSQWNAVSEITAPSVNMSGRSEVSEGRVDFTLTGRPLPIIAKRYVIGTRELQASRMGGSSLDTTTGAAAARVVAEKLEEMLFNGDSLIFNGNSIYGYTTETNRNTDTATNYGGGDWGTITNVVPTVAGMINAAHTDNYFGPYYVYAATTQYNQARNAFFTDGSGDTPYERVLRLSGISGFFPSDTLAAGVVVLVQITRDVVDLAQVPGYFMTNREWVSPDGMTNFFQVMAVAVPRVKSEYSGRSGIVHATGA